MTDPNHNIRIQATIRAIEEQRDGAQTQIVHLKGAMAVVQQVSQKRIAELEKLNADLAAKVAELEQQLGAPAERADEGAAAESEANGASAPERLQ